jgi:two-component system sensor histidine kinase/response regulator
MPRLFIVTAYGDDDTQRQVVREGLHGYLSKPVTASTLFDAIIRAFQKTDRGPLPAAHPAPAQERPLEGAQVLLVEDNDFNQQVAQELLALIGVEVTLANDGREALEKVHQVRFDAVLMDLQMPEMDGYESARRMRQRPELVSLPIIAMTAHALLQEREKCLAIGMNDYVTKPIDPEELTRVLVKWICTSERWPPVREVPARPKQTTQVPALPKSLPGLSQKDGLSFVAGREDLYQNLLRKFLELKAHTLDELQAALDAGEFESAERIAHTMISGATAIGANALSATARTLEQAILSGDASAWEPLVPGFERDLKEVMEGIAAHFDTH